MKIESKIIWDLPLRVFHWLLMFAVIAAIASAKAGNLFVHEKAGISVLSLILFRVIWGFIGSHHARFANFLATPKAVFAYIKKRWAGDRKHYPGHAPTGAWATLAILLVLGGMGSFGLMAQNDILYRAPLADFVGEFSKTATNFHHIGERVVIAVIALHIIALLVYRYGLKIKLLPAMLHGGKDEAAPPISKTKQIFGLVLLATILIIAHSLGMIGNRYY